MRVAQVVDYYPPRLGGVGLIAAELVQALARKGLEVEVITTGRPAEGVRRGLPDDRGVVCACQGEAAFPWRSLSALLARHKARPFDVIHLQHATALALIVRKWVAPGSLPPLVNTLQCSNLEEMRQVRSFRLLDGSWAKLQRAEYQFKFLWGPGHFLIDYFAMRCADLNVALTPATRLELARDYRRDPAGIELANNGVDADRFYPGIPRADLRARFGLAQGPVILFSSAFRARKRVHHAFHVLKLVRERHGLPASLLVVGSGRGYDEDLRALGSRLGLDASVRFAGALPPDQLPPIYAAADVPIILSSFEGVPLTLLEFMALAKPVVATRVSGIPDVIEDGLNGLLVELDDVEGTAAAIARLLSDPGLAARLGAAARAKVCAELTWDHIAARYEEFYRGVVGTRTVNAAL